jgi:HAD superfamily hydrolase (TIGR01509 family)
VNYRALIFDFDGLIIDTEWAAFQAWSAIYQEHGQELPLELWVLCVGSGYGLFDPVAHLSRLTGVSLDRQALLQDKEQRKKKQAALLGPMPGVLDRIREAQFLGLHLGLATSSLAVSVLDHAERLGVLGAFRTVVTADLVTNIKPHPELYQLCAKNLGVSPAECIVLEDSLNGVKAAKAAGMTCIAVPNRVTAGLDFSLADLVVESLAHVNLGRVVHGLTQN